MTKLLGIAMLAGIALLFCGPASGQEQQATQGLTPIPDAWANVYGPTVTQRPVYRVPLYYQGMETVARPRPPVAAPRVYYVRPGWFPCLFGPRWVARPVYGVPR